MSFFRTMIEFLEWPQRTSGEIVPLPQEDISQVTLANGGENSLLTSIQSQVSGDQVDVRIRCSDHENPLDGLGAHKLVLAAARCV